MQIFTNIGKYLTYLILECNYVLFFFTSVSFLTVSKGKWLRRVFWGERNKRPCP